MKNVMKAATLESKFPLLAVENGCIVSKEADVTVAFRVELPELFSVTGSEYEAIHSAWHKAVKVLPEYSIVHKQDFFIEEKYRPETDRDDLSFLNRSFERHFNERPFLSHTCYLFLTKTTKVRSRQESTFSTLCKGRLVPKEIEDRETVTKFLEAVGQFEKIMNDSGFVTLRRLTTDEITGTETAAGIVEKYLSLSQHDTTVLKDIQCGLELYGVPAANIRKVMQAFEGYWDDVQAIGRGEGFSFSSAPSSATGQYDRLYNAIQSGDSEEAAAAMKKLEQMGKTDKVDSELARRLKQYDADVLAAAEARNAGKARAEEKARKAVFEKLREGLDVAPVTDRAKGKTDAARQGRGGPFVRECSYTPYACYVTFPHYYDTTTPPFCPQNAKK